MSSSTSRFISSSDTLRVSSLALQLPLGLGSSAFGLSPSPPCPANLSLSISLRDDVVPSCAVDDTQYGLGVDYSSLSKEIIKLSTSHQWKNVENFLQAVGQHILEIQVVDAVEVQVELPRASLQAESVIYRAVFAQPSSSNQAGSSSHGVTQENPSEETGVVSTLSCELHNIRCMVIVGLREYERREKQWIEIDVKAEELDARVWDHKALGDKVYQWLEVSSYGTIEALVEELTKYIILSAPALQRSPNSAVELTLRKPSALPFATPSISIRRTRSQIHSAKPREPKSSQTTSSDALGSSSSRLSGSECGIYIALGSNLGDRIGNISRAVDLLDSKGLKLVRASRLYESEPMYHEDQDRFINGVVEVQTTLEPIAVLRILKEIEKEIGRTKTFRNGPRIVDLDLLLYRDQIVQIGEIGQPEDQNGVGWLECPHPRIAEREFVLRPLNDIAPTLIHPCQTRSISTLLNTLMLSSKSTVSAIIPFPSPIAPLNLSRGPKIMQIFNATPDSFSDGDIAKTTASTALTEVEKMFDSPFPPHILDIGGMSTRPKAEPCTEEEEISRVVPLIKAIRSSNNETLKSVPISIDTYRPNVAEAAVEAGASCINDVRGGTEPEMLEVMAALSVPVILMHSRGDSTTMLDEDIQDYSEIGGVVNGVKVELEQKIQAALAAGVKPWNIIIDPGLGFAKNGNNSLRLLRHLKDIVDENSPCRGYSMLVGGSRKRFVGIVTQRQEPKERSFGDAAVVGWCQASGVVEIVRVHDGRAMSETVTMWNAISG